MKTLALALAFTTSTSVVASSVDTSPLDQRQMLVDDQSMDAIVAESRQTTQLAWRGHPGAFRGPGPARIGPSHVGPTHIGPTHIGPTYVNPYRGRPYYPRSGWVAPAVGGAIVGAAIANNAQSDATVVNVYPTDDSINAAKSRCASLYRSYDWTSGTYVTADGQVKYCP